MFYPGPAGRTVRWRSAVPPRTAAVRRSGELQDRESPIRGISGRPQPCHARRSTCSCRRAVWTVRRKRPARDGRRDAVGNGRRRRARQASRSSRRNRSFTRSINSVDRFSFRSPPTGGWMDTWSTCTGTRPESATPAGGAIRFSGLLFTNVAFTAGFDVNESFLGPQCRGHVHLRSYAWAMVQAYRLLESRESARHPAATRPLRAVRARALRRAGGQPGFDREPARHPRRHCAR